MARLIVFIITLAAIALLVTGSIITRPELPLSSSPSDNPAQLRSARGSAEVPLTASEPPEIIEGAEYTWQDGDRILRARLATNLTVQRTDSNTSDDVVYASDPQQSIVERQARHGRSNSQPVFVSPSGGLMTLPGGILLVLDPDWDEADVKGFFSRNSISRGGTSELGFVANGFFVESEPGFPSLRLANDLASQDGVILSSPNWWTQAFPK